MRLLLNLVFIVFSYNLLAQSITEIELKKHVTYLASDALEGRKTGTEGDKKAAKYIRNEFKKNGLTLLGEKGYQYFDIITGIEATKNNHLMIGNSHGKFMEDFIPVPISGNGTLEAEVVFVGFGLEIEEDSLKWNDYKNVDVKGKWVLILQGDPEIEKSDSKFIPYSSDRSKVRTALKHGASGVLFVSGEKFDPKDKLTELKFGRGNAQVEIPVIHIKGKIANQILQTEKTINEFEKEISLEKKEIAFSTKTNIKATVEIIYTTKKTHNIIAMIPGKNKNLAQEFIVIGSHYDHLGFGGKNSGSRTPDTVAVHNGADDNASGIASLFEIAERFKDEKKKPERSIIFIAFGAEEMGLLGSAYYTRNPLKELAKTYAMINLDMLGRLNKSEPEVTISGTGTAKEFNQILDDYKDKYGFKTTYSPDGYGSSDHSSFYASNIPVLFFTTGAHQEYHTPLDDSDRINYSGQVNVTNLVYDVLTEFDGRIEPLTFESTGNFSNERPSSRNLKVTLGIIPGFGDTSNKGMRVDGTRKGGPAELGKMKKGDFITAINGQKISNIYDYMDVLGKLELGTLITVDIMRDGKMEVLMIQL
jgi:hypothetical protein